MNKEVEQWQHEYEVLDACCELAQGKIAELKQDIEAYKRSEQEASEIIAELKAENDRLKLSHKELAHYLACMTEQRNRANTCLQEIKTLAEKRFVSCTDTYCDKQIETKECNPKEPCNAYLLRQILQLTKAEEK